MTKNTVIDFTKPSDFSPDPLTDVLRAGARELLATAVRAEVSEFLEGHVHLLNDEGRQRLVQHGFLPEREVMTIAPSRSCKAWPVGNGTGDCETICREGGSARCQSRFLGCATVVQTRMV
ncbi:hypothetical protein OAN307_c40520 [Octadecabacter antarcticus 307]|uniref:Uncharacterized protein n=1 Tax=Octadecabacter antarcticus 307 TaxID=391626 RepID=B5IX28_9RHOB|nr:hypothetical protein [Octadecabacter antarcticus]AGI69469.1 hypothetical protein OAN307_c40520 [Octadecabacter antarcticus 307]